MAIVRDRIAEVGATAKLRRLIGPKTRVLDVKGRRVVPGFYDSHIHLLGSGLRLAEVALKDAIDEEEFGKRLRDFDRKLPRDRWLLGGEWDHDRTFAGRLPTAELIDKYVRDRPVFLRRYDGHMAVVNSRVLHLAGIRAETPDPPGGVIYRKPGSRQPSGVLRDNAMALVDAPHPEGDRGRNHRRRPRRARRGAAGRRHQRARHGRQRLRPRAAGCFVSINSWHARAN